MSSYPIKISPTLNGCCVYLTSNHWSFIDTLIKEFPKREWHYFRKFRKNGRMEFPRLKCVLCGKIGIIICNGMLQYNIQRSYNREVSSHSLKRKHGQKAEVTFEDEFKGSKKDDQKSKHTSEDESEDLEKDDQKSF
ncbi:hypothetical protein GLOIN_2v1482639 [Rhizophagus irregularis DAOM 181602=DAOM 197198]|nr:hypothetical protein GLOIN_2v1482639 [Rhizophagus irregularis DAOM 181602=DAOM 197198]